ncbi:ATP-binding protein [Paenibacillus sp. sgz302251]|uniref:sensor histidine kinase n=1 Tax=Paenibacillus sp. sgz302251 TaxID=3414493 RepID=UPI003C7B66ED
MKIRTKIALLTSTCLIVIMICSDFAIYYLFIKTATENEIEALQTKASQWMTEWDTNSLMQPGLATVTNNLKPPEDVIVRILDVNSKVMHIIYGNESFELPPPRFQAFSRSEITEGGEQNLIAIKVPLTNGNKIVGSLEVFEKMDALDVSKNRLFAILFVSTGGAVLLSFLCGLFLSKAIMKPISDSIRTMQDIEQSLVIKKIPINSRSKDELFHMTETFNRMMRRLEDNYVKQEQFVSDASHELNTTLTIVEGYAKMLMRWGITDEKVQREAVATIYEESKRMRIMTKQMLDLASLQQHNHTDLQSFDLLASCKQAAKLAKKLQPRSIDIKTSGQPRLVVASPNQIKQVLLILLDNALKYSDDNVVLHVLFLDTGIEIRVQDFGIGIPEEHRELVFDRFHRIDQSRHRKTGGAGLGLPIARSIIHEIGGTISIESEVNKGTQFVVWLPRA